MTTHEDYPPLGREAYQAIGPRGNVVAQADTRERAKRLAQIEGVQSPLVIRVILDDPSPSQTTQSAASEAPHA